MAGLDFHARAKGLVALEFLQRRAHVREAVSEEEGGREEKWEKKEFHEAYDNEATKRFKAGGEANAERGMSNASTKHQAPEKHQAPNFKQRVARFHWNLVIGASLELGCWSLELFLAAGTWRDKSKNGRRLLIESDRISWRISTLRHLVRSTLHSI
jgi:hypothetical protein